MSILSLAVRHFIRKRSVELNVKGITINSRIGKNVGFYLDKFAATIYLNWTGACIFLPKLMAFLFRICC